MSNPRGDLVPSMIVPRSDELSDLQLRAIITGQRCVKMKKKGHLHVLTSDISDRTRKMQIKTAKTEYDRWLTGALELNPRIALTLKNKFPNELASMRDLNILVARVLRYSDFDVIDEGRVHERRFTHRCESSTEAKDTEDESVHHVIRESVIRRKNPRQSSLSRNEDTNSVEQHVNIILNNDGSADIFDSNVEGSSRRMSGKRLERYLKGLNPTASLKVVFKDCLRNLGIGGKVAQQHLTTFLKIILKNKVQIDLNDLPETGQTLMKTSNKDRMGAVIYEIFVTPREFFRMQEELRGVDDSDEEHVNRDEMVAEHVLSKSNRNKRRNTRKGTPAVPVKRKRLTTYQSKRNETHVEPDATDTAFETCSQPPSLCENEGSRELPNSSSTGRIYAGKYCHFGLVNGVFGHSIGKILIFFYRMVSYAFYCFLCIFNFFFFFPFLAHFRLR